MESALSTKSLELFGLDNANSVYLNLGCPLPKKIIRLTINISKILIRQSLTVKLSQQINKNYLLLFLLFLEALASLDLAMSVTLFSFQPMVAWSQLLHEIEYLLPD